MTVRISVPVASEPVAMGGSLISDVKLRQLYAMMLQCRLLTERARRLRAPSAALYQSSMGQEAIATGCAIDLRPEDTITPAANDSIACLVKGVPLAELVGQWYARPRLVAEGAQFDAASAAAVNHKRRKQGGVVVVLAGKVPGWIDTLKFAAKRKLPIVFVIINNPWVVTRQVEEEDFTQKARGYGLTGISVDGNDVVAVYRVAHESLDRVRQGDGPVLIEGATYRTAIQQKVTKAQRDPLNHMQQYLVAKNLFTEQWKQKVGQDFSRQLDAAVKAARGT